MADSLAYDPAALPEYKPLAAYGLIGDTRSAALIGDDGSIDWLCLPDFDSSAVFAALLDPRAGRCALRPTVPFHGRQYYEPGTNILCTELSCATGRVCLRDFMPMVPERRLPETEIHRKVEMLSGEMELEIVFEPKLDFGRQPTEVEIVEHGAVAHLAGKKRPSLLLTSGTPLEKTPQGARCRFKMRAGEDCWIILSWEGSPEHSVSAYRSDQRLSRTRSYWHNWLSTLRYQGNYRDAVERSLLTMKMLTYVNTGAVIAAPTASLPEWAGGRRNWDYRYSWVRDASFMLRAMFSAGYIDEGTGFLDWLLRRCREEKGDLHPLYNVHARTDMREEKLLLRGWRDSNPVRIGNAALGQFQLDIYGSLIDAAHHYHDAGGILTVAEAQTLVGLVERVRRCWREPDEGIWEIRGKRKHHTYSKAWAWLALSRGVELARKLGLQVHGEEWQKDANALQAEFLQRAYNTKLKAFVQCYDGDVLDSAVMALPMTGIIKVDDPRFESTREMVVKHLTAGRYPLLYRYDHKQVDDGIGGPEGAFLLPSFWMIEGLAMAGRKQEARAAFWSLLDYGSPLGLFSEQIDPESGALLGNYPQGFSHLGLINAAMRLEGMETT